MLHPENEVNLNRVARPLLHYLCGSAKCIQGTHTLENTKRNFVFLFVFCSLNRTSDLSAQGTFTRKCKEKLVFLLHFARLIVPL